MMWCKWDAACCYTGVARSVVCVSVCWAHGWAVQKRVNRSRCRLEGCLMWVQETIIRWSQDQTNPFAAARSDKSAMRPFAKLLWILLRSRKSRSLRGHQVELNLNPVYLYDTRDTAFLGPDLQNILRQNILRINVNLVKCWNFPMGVPHVKYLERIPRIPRSWNLCLQEKRHTWPR